MSATVVAVPPAVDAPPGWADRAVTGGVFVAGASSEVPPVWGHADGRVLWAEGEPFLLVGPPGVGKTTLAQQVVLARIGLAKQVLGFPVRVSDRRVLYVAADRARQFQRSLRRSVTVPDDLATLDASLTVWPGPLPFDVAAEPERLVGMAKHYDAGTVVIDSLKDVAPALSTDEAGGRVNIALQHCVAQGVEVLVLHHQRKGTSDNRKPNGLDDVYGSTWLTAGAGSVVLLWGKAGDPVVELHHLKQPAEDVGPLTLRHDHDKGTTSLHEPMSVVEVLANAGAEGVTVKEAAKELYGAAAGSEANKVEKARRALERVARSGEARHEPGQRGGEGGGTEARYYAVEPQEALPW